MRHSTRKEPQREPGESQEGSEARAANTAPASPRMVIWVHDGPVCVAVEDSPPPRAGNGVCRCPACHGDREADLAVDFF